MIGDMKKPARKAAPAKKPKPAKRKPREDFNQAAARVVREATKDS
jgi:hypothetical protein